MASVDFNGRSIPLFFTMRNYPKKHNQMDQKKMETAFIKGLQHILPKKYRYTLVADRGFGNDRFAELCQQNGFDYVLRINDNLGLSVEGKKVNLETFAGSDFDIETEVLSWRKTRRFVGYTKGEKHWILMTNLSDKKGAITSFYEQRFGIEMGFKDQKSAGFDIEQSKIRKYDRFKRLLFCVCVAQVLMVIIGEFLTTTHHPLKKKFPLHTALILAFLNLDRERFNGFIEFV